MRVLITFLLFLNFAFANGQEERFTLYNGKRYLIHVVEKGNTMYSISRKYDVDIKEIIDANPFAKEGIKFGQELRIPLFKARTKEYKPEENERFLIHTVRRKETLFSLSQAYQVTIADIERYNPDVRKGIKVGSEIRIPKVAIQNEEKNKDTDQYFYHTVAPKQTLYSLSKLYNIDIAALKAINGGLPNGLKSGDEIKIPRNGDVPTSSEIKEELEDEKKKTD